MKLKLHFLLFLILSALTATAQDGANDPTFNPADTGFGNGADGPIYTTAVQQDGKIILGGIFKHYKSLPFEGIVKINADGTVDPSFNTNLSSAGVTALSIQSDNKIIAGVMASDESGTLLIRLNENGTIDSNFAVSTITFGIIEQILIQPDGKILIGGNFTQINGVNINRLARFNTDGTLDATFNIGSGANNYVRGMGLQGDGKIVVVGGFTNFNNVPKNRIARLNTDGSIDTSFVTTLALGHLYGVRIQSDNKIVTCGYINNNGVIASKVIRFNLNGTVDDVFDLGSEINLALAIQADGSIVTGGFSDLFRINNNGTIDVSFTKHHNGTIWSVENISEDKLLIAGAFTIFNNEIEDYIVSLNTDGSIDSTFDIGPGTGADNTILSSFRHSNGNIIITGEFNNYNGVARKGVANLDAEGNLNTAFDIGTGANGKVTGGVATADGKIVLVGDFTTFSGITANGIVRLNADGTVDSSFNIGAGFINSNDITAIYGVLLQADGKLIVSGRIRKYNNIVLPAPICRINTDGSLDENFSLNPALQQVNTDNGFRNVMLLSDGSMILLYNNVGSSNGVFGNAVAKIDSSGNVDNTFTPFSFNNFFQAGTAAVLSDGKILVSGLAGGTPKLVRLNVNGTLDTTITNLGAPSFILQQEDGKVILQTSVETSPGVVETLVRCNADLTIDTTFDSGTGPNSTVTGIIPQGNKLIITGAFTSYNGVGRNRIARLQSTGAMSTDIPVHAEKNVLVYRTVNELNVASSGEPIAAVEVYDVTGKFIAKQDKLNTQLVIFENIQRNKVLVVKTHLKNGKVVSTKTL
jgi:uncharacterized delta-60 repeat protein